MKYLISIFCLLSISLFGQQNTLESQFAIRSINEVNSINTSGTWVPDRVEDKTIIGSPYLFRSWNGIFKLITKSGLENNIFNLNYNLKTKTIESFISKDSVFQYDLANIDYINVKNNKYKVYINNNKEDLNGLYQELFSSDKYIFLKEFKVSILAGTINPLTQEKITQDQYVQTFKYFFKKSNEFKSTKLNKSNIMSFFEDKKDLIKKFVNDNNLSFSEEADVVKMISYYASI